MHAAKLFHFHIFTNTDQTYENNKRKKFALKKTMLWRLSVSKVALVAGEIMQR